MSLFEARRNRGSRNSGSRRRTAFLIETLEVRSLLSAAAIIRRAMEPQIFLDPNHGNEPDLPNTPAYVNPPSGYGVLLNASHSTGISPRTTFAWTVTNSVGQTTAPLRRTPQHQSAPGDLHGQAHGDGTLEIDQAALGDDQDPGQGRVDRLDRRLVRLGRREPGCSRCFFPEWAYSPNPAMNIENADAHRSTITGSAEFALALQRSNPHEAVTFVSVAASVRPFRRGCWAQWPASAIRATCSSLSSRS